MATVVPPSTPVITNDDRSALVEIAVYFLTTTFILSVIFRFAVRLGIAKTVTTSDWLCLASMVAGIGQAIAVLLGVKHGLGKKQSLLNSSQEQAVAQAEYAGDILYMLTLGLAKASVLLLLRGICVDKKHRLVTLTTSCVVLAWTLGGVATLAARCGGHLPWNATDVQGQCINMATFWEAMLSVDILTEIIVITLPILMVIRLHTALAKKAVIVAAFMFRLLLVAASTVRVFYLIDYIPSSNFAFRLVDMEIASQVVLAISITSACVPCLKPFLDVFDSGQMAVIFRNGTPHSTGNSYPMRSLGYAKSEDSARRMRRKNPDFETTQPVREQSDSISSDTRSDDMIINKKVEYTVRYEAVHADNKRVQSKIPRHTRAGEWH